MKGDWKAIRLNVDQNPNGKLLLYNIKQDPAETIDLADKNPAIVKQMEIIMDKAHTPSALFPFAGEKH
ncbi:hypothetical protein [Arachidicoccus ginsenosidivorans]|uniref:hypothetical protein n=1 Tax=Arachidicoccus ginsenosidivorans TaxID=496057 RepID=UPI001CEF9161|nr:hypothetical protein [Arachidicoccus ginsenosidivorans]